MSFETYTVKGGDTLWAIGNQYQINWRSIAAVNKDTLPNPNLIKVGQKLQVPNRAAFMQVIDNILELVGWVKGLLSLAKELIALQNNPTKAQLNEVLKNAGLTAIDALLWKLHPIAGALFTLGWILVSYWQDITGWFKNEK